LAVGAAVNLEGDLIAKHVERLVTARLDHAEEASARDAAGRKRSHVG